MEDDDVEYEESIVVVAAAFANITVQVLLYLETNEIEYVIHRE
jgi:hypothetical protein